MTKIHSAVPLMDEVSKKKQTPTNSLMSGKWSTDRDGLIYDNDNKLIADAYAYKNKVTEKVRATASFIVQACNATEKL